MIKSILFTDSQKVIFLTAVYLALFMHFLFFTKLYGFAASENNYAVMITAPFVLFLLLVLVLNIVLLVTYKRSFFGILVVLLLVSSFSSYFMNTFGTILDKDMIANAFETDSTEAFDLLTPKLFMYMFLFFVLPFFLILKYKIDYKNYKTELLNRAFMIFATLLIAGASYMLLSKSYSSFFRNHGELRQYLNPSYPIYSFVKYAKREFRAPKVITPIASDAKREAKEKKKLFIFVVGETARAENFSLNGYVNETNPL
ncbi:phosphoethanolamine transferase domain-containing protein, partial [Sulfurimonas sp. RIFCSPLOWO2_12_36_12]|uniref:phosphoethanolamine transferase domain-containing protein n=1 Tax=Sulfurimonas sp. RIFCSPLOWO2_12_36_12 TaxID=1802253 RepID=UPI000AD2336E